MYRPLEVERKSDAQEENLDNKGGGHTENTEKNPWGNNIEVSQGKRYMTAETLNSKQLQL